MSAVQRAFGRVCALGLVSVAAACAAHKTSVVPPGGAIYAHYKAPLTSNHEGAPTGAGVAKASSSQTKFLWIPLNAALSFSWDDAAIAKIASDAGMSSVAYADYELFSVLGIWQTFTVHVYGN
jgi:hypothetical protein